MVIDPEKSQIDALTQQAYRRALDEVLTDIPFVLRIGVQNTKLVALFEQYRVASAAFITAYNPFGEPVSEETNRAAQNWLYSHLSQLGLFTLPGIGKDPSGSWPGEPSFLVLGASMATACDVGKKFSQNAIVWADGDAVPTLLLLR